MKKIEKMEKKWKKMEKKWKIHNKCNFKIYQFLYKIKYKHYLKAFCPQTY